MSPLMAASLGVGIPCALWPVMATLTELPLWIMFASCTSYFVCGAGKTGFIKAVCSNYAGMFWAFLVFTFGGLSFMQEPGVQTIILGALATGFISWAMTYQSKVDFLSFVPATFIGAFSSFASGGDWKNLAICFILGHFLGAACTVCGQVLTKMFVKE